jgi:thiol-disulfide isomerase/thioredoxin
MPKFMSGAAAFIFTLSAFAQQLPRPAKDYPIQLGGGKTVMVSQMKGRPAVIEFLLTTCPHCQHTAEVLSKLSKEFGGRVQMYGVAMNEGGDVASFIKEHNVTFPVGTGPREPVYDFLDHSLMNPRISFPQLLFIDKNGVIQAQHEGGQDFLGPDQEKNIRAELQKLVASGGAARKGTTAAAPRKKAS